MNEDKTRVLPVIDEETQVLHSVNYAPAERHSKGWREAAYVGVGVLAAAVIFSSFAHARSNASGAANQNVVTEECMSALRSTQAQLQEAQRQSGSSSGTISGMARAFGNASASLQPCINIAGAVGVYTKTAQMAFASASDDLWKGLMSNSQTTVNTSTTEFEKGNEAMENCYNFLADHDQYL